jgi:hypothetical protein
MPEVTSSKYLTQMGWDETPHLTEDAKRELLGSTQPYLRDARSKGVPSLGAGAIFPIPESEFVIPPMKLADHWPRIAALDVGWRRTATLWGAHDLETSTIYFYSEHYRAEAEPSVHATAIRARGEWIPVLIDPAARGRSQRDGENLMKDYTNLGLKLRQAKNAIESGILRIWELLSTGRIKVFASLSNFLAEYRLYRRDKKGRIVDEFNHLMDCWRYLVVGVGQAMVEVRANYEDPWAHSNKRSSVAGGWMR